MVIISGGISVIFILIMVTTNNKVHSDDYNDYDMKVHGNDEDNDGETSNTYNIQSNNDTNTI